MRLIVPCQDLYRYVYYHLSFLLDYYPHHLVSLYIPSRFDTWVCHGLSPQRRLEEKYPNSPSPSLDMKSGSLSRCRAPPRACCNFLYLVYHSNCSCNYVFIYFVIYLDINSLLAGFCFILSKLSNKDVQKGVFKFDTSFCFSGIIYIWLQFKNQSKKNDKQI